MRVPAAWEPWCRTVLRFGTGECEVHLLERVPDTTRAELRALGLPGPFAVITPCNPNGVPLDHDANANFLTAAGASLGDWGVDGVRVIGRSPDGGHREPGWALSVPKLDAVRIARDWQQAGLYWWDGTRFWIVPTAPDMPELALPP